MLPLEDLRTKLLAQRRELFRQAAQTEEDLLWLETDVEPEAMERGRTETMVRLLHRRNIRSVTPKISSASAIVSSRRCRRAYSSSKRIWRTSWNTLARIYGGPPWEATLNRTDDVLPTLSQR